MDTDLRNRVLSPEEDGSDVRPQRRTGVVRDPRYAGHCMGPEEPECQQRLDVLDAMLQEPELRGRFTPVSPRPVGRDELERVHSPDYIRRLESTAHKTLTYLDADTRTAPRSHEAALLAAGGLCRAIELVSNGTLDNAFALIRPPGHHAERAAAKGFCLLNNVAVAARYAQNSLKLNRILIVDWDLHHGNGTQHCFESDPTLLFFSTHRAFTYPGTGRLREIGKAEGKGYTINIPLPAGFGDAEYLTLFQKILKPVAHEFDPDLVLVSAGFDIHYEDPIGGMQVTPEGFAGMTKILLDIASHCCSGRLVMSLEGGYGLDGLRDSVREVLKEMAGLRTTDVAARIAVCDTRKTDYVLWRVGRVHRNYWKSLSAIESNGRRVAPTILERLRGNLSRMGAYFKS